MAFRTARPSATRASSSPDPLRLLGGCADLVVMLDAEGAITAANRDIERGVPLAYLAVEEAAATVTDAVESALRGASATIEVPLAGDRPRWHRIHVAPAGHGQAVAILTDTDARHREEDRLRRSERLMVDTQGLTHLGTWYWDINEPYARWSQELYRIYGLDPDTHAPSYEDYLERVHPDDRARVAAATAAVMEDHKPYSHDERILHTDGTWRDLHTWAEAVLDDEGNLVALQGVCQDITARRRAERAREASEARHKAIFEGSPFGIAIVDETVREANPALLRMAGRIRIRVEAHPFQDLFEADDRPRVAAALDGARDGTERLVARLAQGPRVGITFSPAATAHGDTFVVAMLEDISDEEKSKAQKQRIEDLETEGQMRARMLHVAGHELRNPLTPLLLQLALLKKGKHGSLSKAQAEAVERLDRQAKRLKSLVSGLLDYARIEEGQLQLHRQRTALAPLVHSSIDGLQASADEWGVSLAARTDDVDVAADPARLEQVIWNLIGNALKFTPKGGRVQVRLRRDGDDALVEVEDGGPGVPGDRRDVIFQPFTRVEGLDGREEGTGMGLPVARALVEAHGGTIGVRDGGDGAVFWFRLAALPTKS